VQNPRYPLQQIRGIPAVVVGERQDFAFGVSQADVASPGQSPGRPQVPQDDRPAQTPQDRTQTVVGILVNDQDLHGPVGLGSQRVQKATDLASTVHRGQD
jgi:hypothetical protein